MLKPILSFILIFMSESALAAPLHEAVLEGNDVQIAHLLKLGAEIDERDAKGQTPLLLAVGEGNLAVAKLLLKSGASVNKQADNKDTPWLLAGASGRTEILKLMWPMKPDLSMRNRYGGNALIPACERGHVDTVEFLLTTDIDVDHVNDLGWTCLLEAVILGDGGKDHQNIVKLVLDNGGNPNLADKDGVTALTHAKSKGQAEIAALIETAGGR